MISLATDCKNPPTHLHEHPIQKEYLWNDVVADYDAIIAIGADNAAEHHFQRGHAHARPENRDAAEADYLKALELGYDQASVRHALTDLAQ